MKKLVIIALIMLSTCWVQAQSSSETMLSVTVTDLRSEQGVVAMQILNAQDVVVKEFRLPISNGQVRCAVKSLPMGQYGVKYFHDEDEDDELDTNLVGIPKEGYGFSNNAHGTFGPPAKEKTLFDLSGSVSQKLKVKYLY